MSGVQLCRPQPLLVGERAGHEDHDARTRRLPPLRRELATDVVARDAELDELAPAHDAELVDSELIQPGDGGHGFGST
jgi:hypothetical protein